MGGGYGRNPLFVRARHVQRCVKKCPHFECVIHRFVLALNAGTNTLYTRVYIVRMFMLSNEDTYMNFNLNTVDVPSNEDGPRSSDIGNDFNIT